MSFDLLAGLPFTGFLLYVSDDAFAYTYLPAFKRWLSWPIPVLGEVAK